MCESTNLRGPKRVIQDAAQQNAIQGLEERQEARPFYDSFMLSDLGRGLLSSVPSLLSFFYLSYKAVNQTSFPALMVMALLSPKSPEESHVTR